METKRRVFGSKTDKIGKYEDLFPGKNKPVFKNYRKKTGWLP